MSAVSVRRMTTADVSAASELRRLVGWNQTEQDWHRMLSLEPEGCFVAMRGGDLIGSVTTTTYGDAMAWIGMMLVHPAHRRQGIGRLLMRRAMGHLEDLKLRCIRLDATPAGLPLYTQLGFVPEWTLTRWHRPAPNQVGHRTDASHDARPLTQSDWPAVEALDAVAFGLSRCALLRSLAQGCRNVLVWPAQGRIAGWGMVRPGSVSDYLGPVECASAEVAERLVDVLVRGIQATPIFWDFPDQNESAKGIARRLGFEPVRPLTRMCLGQKAQQAPDQTMFAIADPAVG